MAEQTEFQALQNSLHNLEVDLNGEGSKRKPLLKEIQQHTLSARKAMAQDPVDTLTLSNELVELAILLQRLGDRIAECGFIVRAAKEYYERTREEHKVRLVNEEAKPAGVADSMKASLVKEEFEFYNKCEYRMDKLVYTRKSTDKTIDAIRSKLSYEKINETR